MTDRLRVVTMNLWGRRGSWPERREVLAAGLQELDPDLIAFQEAVVSDEYDQVEDLLGSDLHVAHQTAREPGGPGDVEAGQGASIASGWPLGEVHEVDLHVTPRTSDFACTTLVSEVRAPSRSGGCCSRTTCRTGSCTSNESVSCRPSRRAARWRSSRRSATGTSSSPAT